jgi:hypothetical protein
METAMNKIRVFACTALLVSLAACQGNPAPGGNASANTPADKDSGLAGMVGAAMDKARAEMATKNIRIGDGMRINVNGHEIDSTDGNQPRAEITPRGDLLIEGKAVAVTPAQRELLLEYRGEIIDVASAGMDIGKQGVGIAGKAVSTAIAGIFNGKTDEAQREMEAEGKRIEAAAMQLCERLKPMLQTQQQLAASLPAFKPYAKLEQSDIDDCRKHDRGDGVAVFSDEGRGQAREEIRREVRDGIRESIRSAVRTPSSADPAHEDAAAEADAAAAKGGLMQ